ncbi:hypothetical protein ACFXKI_10360 [Streptomyces mirabilis]
MYGDRPIGHVLAEKSRIEDLGEAHNFRGTALAETTRKITGAIDAA